jgi:hypothetical protein
MDLVLHNFHQAEALDPASQRIRDNRALAEAWRGKPTSSRDKWMIDERASGEQALREAYSPDQPAPDLFVERSDTGLAALLQHA